MTAKKEEIMRQVRGEFALQNAQTLMNVSLACSVEFVPYPLRLFTDHERQMLREMRAEPIRIPHELRRGALRYFLVLPAILIVSVNTDMSCKVHGEVYGSL